MLSRHRPEWPGPYHPERSEPSGGSGALPWGVAMASTEEVWLPHARCRRCGGAGARLHTSRESGTLAEDAQDVS